MVEAETTLARYLRIFFTRLFVTWWGSLDDVAKGNIEVTILVMLSIGILLFLLTRLPRRHVAIGAQPSKSAIQVVEHREALIGKATSFQKQLLAGWTMLNGEVRVGSLLCMAFLILAAFGSWPYNFYILTRIVVCFSFACLAVLLHRRRRFVWEAAIAFWALLFNPVAPFRFAKDTWQLFNIAALITLISALFVYARNQVGVARETAVPLNSKNLEAVGLVESEMKSRAYRYCESCSVRVGRSDTFCKRCGEALG